MQERAAEDVRDGRAHRRPYVTLHAEDAPVAERLRIEHRLQLGEGELVRVLELAVALELTLHGVLYTRARALARDLGWQLFENGR